MLPDPVVAVVGPICDRTLKPVALTFCRLYQRVSWPSCRLTALLAGIVLSLQVQAEDTSTSAADGNTIVYPAADYAVSGPQTALDMVRRTPGFVLDEGDSDLRGYGAAGGNVLVDGARPVSKTGVVDALSRIAASQVERIELIRSASTAEAQGQSLILNVVLAREATSGTWSAELERNGNGKLYPRVDLSFSRASGGWESSLRANAFWEEFPFYTNRVLRDADGELQSTVVTDLPSTLVNAYLSGETKGPVAGGILKLSARLGRYRYYFAQPGEIYLGRFPDGQPDRTALTRFSNSRWDLELGADYSVQRGDWNWKTLGLLTFKDGNEAQSDPLRDADGNLLSNTLVDASARPLELVARLTAARATESAIRPEFGVELAYNRRDSDFALAVDDGTGPVAIALPGADVQVEEKRLEAFARASWRLSDAITVDGELAIENSTISVSGETNQSQSFNFIKPALALTWRSSEQLSWQLGARHRVGQLDFGDFAASASLNDGTSAAGNPDLGPDQATRYFLSMDFRRPDGLALNLEAFYEARKDVLEEVLLPSGAPGLANAGDASYRGIKSQLTLPLEKALKGARLTVDAQWLKSEFDDPLIAATRSLSRVYSPLINAEFRHDIESKRLSWGLTWSAANDGDVYRVAEIDRLRTGDAYGAFVEGSALGLFRTRLAVRNAGDKISFRDRRFFDGDRGGPLLRTEDRRQVNPIFVTLTFSGSF